MFFRLPDTSPETEAEWLQHGQQIVRRKTSGSFYIGITADPVRRFLEGHSQSGNFHAMDVIAVVSSSLTSAKIERGLLGIFRGHPNCMNQSWGGESPTPGYPHYVYVVSRADGLHRSNRSTSGRFRGTVADDIRMWSGIYGADGRA